MAITVLELKKIRRCERLKETKTIERQLHPNLKIGKIEIAHQHSQNGKIYFTAWDGENQINKDKHLCFPRSWISRHEQPGEFYKLYRKEFEWLLKQI